MNTTAAITVVPLRAGRAAPKAARSEMQTMIYKAPAIGAWRVPPFQRPLHVNAKVQELSCDIAKAGGIIPGVITLGRVKGDTATYIVDGQHRLEAFRLSGLPELLADFRIVEFDDLAEMAEEFVRLNSALVRMRPDDILRGLEASLPALQRIRAACRFVSYDQIRRRSTTSPILSMSLVLRTWNGSVPETPVASGPSATSIANNLALEAADDLILFLITAHDAWGRDLEYARLWSALNLGLCMWLWRRLVRDVDRSSSTRHLRLTIKQFSTCLMALSADRQYVDWLQGRALGDRDRNPAYTRIKRIWTARLSEDGMRDKIQFPQPAWASKS
jgi:hypothetical protein